MITGKDSTYMTYLPAMYPLKKNQSFHICGYPLILVDTFLQGLFYLFLNKFI